MATFRGILEIEGEPDSGVIADVDVSKGMMTIRAAGGEIGHWDLNDLAITEHAGAFRIAAEEDVVLLRLNDPKRFAGTVGVTLHSEFGDPFAPRVTPNPVKRAPPDTRKITDEPIETFAAPRATSPPVPWFAAEGKRGGPDQTPLARPLSWAMAGAGAVLFLGALLDWGPVRLTNANFPIGRLLVLLAGFGAFAAAYLGLALEKRRDVALVALVSAVIAVMVIVMFARRAAIGWGFIVTILGAVAVVSISVLALSQLGAPPSTESEDEPDQGIAPA